MIGSGLLDASLSAFFAKVHALAAQGLSLHHTPFIVGALAFACSNYEGPPLISPPHSPYAGHDRSGTPDPKSGGDIEWRACPVTQSSGENHSECASIPVPLDYTDPDGPSIDIAVRKIPATLAPTGQLWLLHGGPGASGVEDMAGLARALPALRPELEIFTLDHRGVGQSERMDCPDEEGPGSEIGSTISAQEWPRCVEHLKTELASLLPHMTPSNTARDLGLLIERMRQPDTRTMVWGGSYGTYLALRYLQLFPEQPNAVVLEGISPPGQGFDTYDRDMDEVGQELFEKCAEHASCAEHLGEEPWSRVQELLASVDAGHCPELGADSGTLRTLLGSLTFYGVIRNLVPAVVYRAERCSEDDVHAIESLLGILFGTGTGQNSDAPAELLGTLDKIRNSTLLGQGTTDSDALFFHVALSEMWHAEGDPDVSTVVHEWETLTSATGLTVRIANRQQDWPRYARDELVGELPEYSGPLLMMQGGLDPATPLKNAAFLAERFNAPAQTFATFPEAAHDPGDWTPLPGGEHCALNIYAEFLRAPTEPLDLSCIQRIEPIEFDGRPAITRALMGTEDAWGDGAPPSDTPGTELTADALR